MTLKRRAQQRLRDLLATSGEYVPEEIHGQLESLPPGWAKLVDGMLSQTAQILTDDEVRTFRWTEIRERDGRLTVSWTGADDSHDLVDQIAETAVADAAATCAECGLPSLQGPEAAHPYCLLHAGLEAATGEWKAVAIELRRNLHEILGRVPSPAAAKAVASALPALISEAQGYFRSPDRDVAAMLRQLREALRQLDRAAHRSVGVPLLNKRS